MFLWKPIWHKKTTRMLYGDAMFLSTILLKLSGAVNGHYWTLLCLVCNKVAIFMQFSAGPYGGPYGLKEHRNLFMVMKCFCLQKLLKHSLPINRLLHINLDTSDIPMPHLCITAPKYGGLNRTFYDIRKTQFLSIFLSYECKNEKWLTCCGANFGSIKTCQTLW